MEEWPFSIPVKFAAVIKRLSITTDSNVFEQEKSKMVTLGRLRQTKVLSTCDGKGGMHAYYLEDPVKQIEKLAKLRDKGHITEADFVRVKDKLLGQLDPQPDK